MSHFTHTWRDEAKRRDVELNVNYSLEDNSVYIHHITPVQVTFHGQGRSVKVHTATGRELLVSAFQQNGDSMPTLEQLILSRELLTHRSTTVA